MVQLAAAICEDKKGTDTRILELDPVDAGFTDFFLITSGSNTRQTGAIADEIEVRMKQDFGTYAKSVEGRRTGEWILLDYVDFVVHIFTEETREYYDIERLRKSAKAMSPAELSATLREKTEAARKKSPAKTPADLPAAALPRKVSLKKAPAKKAATKQATAEDGTREPSPAKKAAIKKAPAKAPAKKAAAKKAPAKKAPAKKAAIKKSAVTKRAGTPVEDTSRRALPASTTPRRLPPPSKG